MGFSSFHSAITKCIIAFPSVVVKVVIHILVYDNLKQIIHTLECFILKFYLPETEHTMCIIS